MDGGKKIGWLRNLLTEDADGNVPCPARIGWAVGVISFVGLAAVHVAFNHAAFDAQSYGIGFGTINAAGGVALLMKGKSGE